MLLVTLIYSLWWLLSNGKSYQDDLHIKVVMDRLSINSPLDEPNILQLPVVYRTTIIRNISRLVEGCLVYYEPIPTVTNHICRIVVPIFFRRAIFTLMYVTSIIGNMGKYKILYRVKFRLSYLYCVLTLLDGLKMPPCMLAYRWRRRWQELVFSWPVRSSFVILHIHLWIPGHPKDSNDYIALMNAMCDMNQFVVVVHVHDDSSSLLAKTFMHYVLIKFGICHLVAMDDENPFKWAFIVICECLHLNYNVLAKRNHKGLTVEHFHRFLNKSVTIATEERGTNDIFVPVGIVIGYVWNSTSIDGTDILRRIPAICRELHILLILI